MLKLEKTVKADREKVFDIFSNYELFAKIIPEYYSSIVQRSLRGNVSIVAEHLKLLDEEFVIMTTHIITPYDSHESIVVGGDVVLGKVVVVSVVDEPMINVVVGGTVVIFIL